LPALRRERGLSGQSVWKILDLRPYAEPLHQLDDTERNAVQIRYRILRRYLAG
jgi:hypothetical protein